MNTRLYELADDEMFSDDPAAAYEVWECETDEEWIQEFGRHPGNPEGTALTIIEWEAGPISDYLSSGKRIIERELEILWEDYLGDWAEPLLDRISDNKEIIEAFEQARTKLAASMTGWTVATKQLRTIEVTWDESLQPLLDGDPMYVLGRN